MLYNLLVLDDHPLIIEGIKLMINGSETYRIKASFTDLDELLSATPIPGISIIILDINVKGKNALDEIHQLKSLYPFSKIVAFTSYYNPSLIRECKSLELQGYILKDITRSELLDCLGEVIQGNLFYKSPELNPEPVQNKWQLNASRISDQYKLSNRETDVFKLLIKGESETNIASELYLSKHTVHTHNKNIKRKLGVNNVVQMMKLVYEERYQ